MTAPIGLSASGSGASQYLAPSLARPEVKADQFQAEFIETIFDLGQREAVFLHMKQQVAAGGQGKKIHVLFNAGGRVVTGKGQYILPGFPDVIGRDRFGIRQYLPCGNDISSAQFTVQTDAHQPMFAEQSDQYPPAGHGIGHVMDHAGAFDQVEFPIRRCQVQNICL